MVTIAPLRRGRAHRAAASGWGQRTPDSYAYPEKIIGPVLVLNGGNDIVIDTVKSFILRLRRPDARLTVCPHSGHGAHLQYPGLFAQQAGFFLDG